MNIDFENMDPKTMMMLLQFLQIKRRMEAEQQQAQTQQPDESWTRTNSKDLRDVLNETNRYLKEWTGFNSYETVYDTTRQPFDKDDFFNHCLNKNDLIFLFQDGRGNVFGCYMKTPITQLSVGMNYIPNYCPHHFIFSLESNGRIDQPTKWDVKNGQQGGIFFFKNGPTFIDIGNHVGRIVVIVPGYPNGYMKDLGNTYQDVNTHLIAGVNGTAMNFTLNRCIVLQMKQQ